MSQGEPNDFIQHTANQDFATFSLNHGPAAVASAGCYGAQLSQLNTNFWSDDQWKAQFWPYNGYNAPWTITTYNTAKVRLKLSELLKLREAGAADKALKDILVKLTPAIEVEIDL